jgi:hypothetical protein
VTARTKQDCISSEASITVSQNKLGGLPTTGAALFSPFTKFFRTLAADTSPVGMEEVTGLFNRSMNRAFQIDRPTIVQNAPFFVEFRQLSRVRSTESSGFLERAMGIEPTSEAWEASILPLYDARSLFFIVLEKWFISRFFVSTRSCLSRAKGEGIQYREHYLIHADT